MKGREVESLREFLVTVDTDWAPDWCIQWLIERLLDLHYKPTVFFTNVSEVPKIFASEIEIGIHPDFSRKNFEESVIDFKHLKAEFPDAVISRSHRNVFGQHIARLLTENGIRFDVSTLLFNIDTSNWTDSRGLRRISYSFEDGVFLDSLGLNSVSEIYFSQKKPTIINLHPVLCYLNSVSDENRRHFTNKYVNLSQVSEMDFKNFRNISNKGIADLVWEILKNGKQSKESIYDQ